MTSETFKFLKCSRTGKNATLDQGIQRIVDIHEHFLKTLAQGALIQQNV